MAQGRVGGAAAAAPDTRAPEPTRTGAVGNQVSCTVRKHKHSACNLQTGRLGLTFTLAVTAVVSFHEVPPIVMYLGMWLDPSQL